MDEFKWNRARPPKFEDLFVASGLASSKSDARRLIEGKGLRIRHETWEGEVVYGQVVPEEAIVESGGERFVVLLKGKKNDAILHVEFE